jgi:putative SbcD/Mre11-related phosphoesterase
MNITPIPNEPAILIKFRNEKILTVADLHIGIETSYRDAGANIPSQSKKMVNRLISLCEKENIKRLILLGDIKHKIPSTSFQELEEIPELFYKLSETVEHIDIVLGNHDGNFERFVPEISDIKINIHSSKGFLINVFGFFHGHTWPDKKLMKCDYILIGHNHPNIVFTDELGGRLYKQCWVRASFNTEITSRRYKDFNHEAELIILPAFNNLGTGTLINDANQKMLGPIIKNGLVDMDNARIILLNGTYLGKLKLLHNLAIQK